MRIIIIEDHGEHSELKRNSISIKTIPWQNPLHLSHLYAVCLSSDRSKSLYRFVLTIPRQSDTTQLNAMTSLCEDGDQTSSLGSREDLERLRLENEMLRKDLEDCKDQLFEALHKSNDIPEGDIKAAFSRVYSGIDAWIDEIACEDGYEEAFRAHFKKKIQDGSDLESLGFHHRCYSSVEWRVRLSKLPHCFHIIVSLLISKFLTDEVFRVARADEWSHLCPHGLSDHDIKTLVRLQDVMRTKLHRGMLRLNIETAFSFSDSWLGKIDESEISRWRGQSISAMVTSEAAKERAKKASEEHVNKLHRKLGIWLDKPVSKPLSDSLMGSIIQRANKALEMICCSNKTYLIGNPEIPPGPIIEQAESWNLKDLVTWRKMSAHEDGALLQCLYPGLMRIGESGQDDLLLVKPTWMGYENQKLLPLPVSRSPSPRKQGSNTLDREIGDRKSNRQRKPKSSSKPWTAWFASSDRGSAKSSARPSNKTSSAYPMEHHNPQYAQYTGEYESYPAYSPMSPIAANYPQRTSTFPEPGQESHETARQDDRSRRSLSY